MGFLRTIKVIHNGINSSLQDLNPATNKTESWKTTASCE